MNIRIRLEKQRAGISTFNSKTNKLRRPCWVVQNPECRFRRGQQVLPRHQRWPVEHRAVLHQRLRQPRLLLPLQRLWLRAPRLPSPQAPRRLKRVKLLRPR